MKKENIIEEINGEAINEVCEGMSRGNVVTKLVVGALCAVATVGTFVFLKKRKARKAQEIEEVELNQNDDKQTRK